MGKESLRARLRRQARENLQQLDAHPGAATALPVSRRPPTSEEVSQLFAAIDHGKQSHMFGLAKLVALDIDGLHVPPRPLPDLAPAVTTLVHYAAQRGVDAVVAALLRAGADPSVRVGSTTTRGGAGGAVPCGAGHATSTCHSAGVRKWLSNRRPAHAVLLVREVVAMRRRGEALQPTAASRSCGVCRSEHALSMQPLVWSAECKHTLCEPCYWEEQKRWQQHLDEAGCWALPPDMECPVCCGGAEQALKAAAVAAQTSTHTGIAQTQEAWLKDEGSRVDRRDTSLALWLALPESAAERLQLEKAGKRKKSKKVQFAALSRASAAAGNPGGLRSQRVERWLEAAASGDGFKLLAIAEAGVDVNASNECGETAAHTAAWLGLAHTLRVLAWAGASLEQQAYGGWTPRSAAAARGHTAVLSVLDQCAPSTPSPSPSQLQPEPEYQSEPFLPEPEYQRLISHTSPHPGAGAVLVDRAFSAGFLAALDSLYTSIPSAEVDRQDRIAQQKGRSYAKTCATRSFFCDGDGWVQKVLAPVAKAALANECVAAGQGGGGDGWQVHVMSRMRFLCYRDVGGDMQPHVDLQKSDPCGSSLTASYDTPERSIDDLMRGAESGMQNENRPSTHTFMLHLADCPKGGETVFLSQLHRASAAAAAAQANKEVAVASDDRPKRQEVAHVGDDPGARPTTPDGALTTSRTRPSGETDDDDGDDDSGGSGGGDDAGIVVLGSASPMRGRLVIFPHKCPHAGRPVVDVPKLFLRGELRYSSSGY